MMNTARRIATWGCGALAALKLISCAPTTSGYGYGPGPAPVPAQRVDPYQGASFSGAHRPVRQSDLTHEERMARYEQRLAEQYAKKRLRDQYRLQDNIQSAPLKIAEGFVRGGTNGARNAASRRGRNIANDIFGGY